MAKKTVKKAAKPNLVKDEVAEAYATLEDIKSLQELTSIITARIDRIVAAMSKGKVIKKDF